MQSTKKKTVFPFPIRVTISSLNHCTHSVVHHEESSNLELAREAMVSMNSVHAGDAVFSGFPFVRSKSTQSHMLSSGQIIGETEDASKGEDYLEELGRPVQVQKPGGK